MNATTAQNRIIKAIRANQTEAGQWLSLSLVRDEAGLLRKDFDKAMAKLATSFRVVLVPEDNQKTITEIDSRNAVTVGGQACHLVTLG